MSRVTNVKPRAFGVKWAQDSCLFTVYTFETHQNHPLTDPQCSRFHLVVVLNLCLSAVGVSKKVCVCL